MKGYEYKIRYGVKKNHRWNNNVYRFYSFIYRFSKNLFLDFLRCSNYFIDYRNNRCQRRT